MTVTRASRAARAGWRDGVWRADPDFGVYVHIPFCLHRCHYCDFNTYEGLEALYEPYADALVRDIERWDGERRPATSIFFGGGTPTLLSPATLARILGAVTARVGATGDVETTIEANPETVDEAAFEALLAAGFNRFSIGVQSLQSHVLQGLGRTHSASRALEALGAARRAGVGDVNIDLIFGSPWESAADWRATLERAIAAEPDHISAYALSVEEGTPLATLVTTGRVADVDPDTQAERYELACELLGAAGYDRYEVSNWSKPGRASRHNVLYWCAGDYLAFGAGAHGHVSGERWWNTRLPRDFVTAVAEDRTTRQDGESLDLDRRAGEALMLGLRLTSGIDLDEFAARFGYDELQTRAGEIDKIVAMGLLERLDGRVRLTERGTLLANEALSRLL